jgi:hypothetical protein
VRIPDKARLDFGFCLEKEDRAVKIRISAREGAAEPRTLLELTFPEGTPRLQRSVDLSAFSGKTITLALETEAPQPGNIAYWASPMLSGERKTDKPDIIFYVIDGAAAEFMSVYGHSPRTTPNLERLAAEGVVFENAYSNSSRTKTSVPSFMTSLQSSVMGGSRSESDPLPARAVTMAERLHKAGYVTEVLTSNPYCGRASSLDRGVDVTRDTAWGDKRPTSVDLHREFWRLREAYPGEPYWVHFQPTDIHQPWDPRASFPGLFASPEDRRVRHVDLSAKGRELIDRGIRERYRWVDDLVDELHADQRAVIAGLAQSVWQKLRFGLEHKSAVRQADHAGDMRPLAGQERGAAGRTE